MPADNWQRRLLLCDSDRHAFRKLPMQQVSDGCSRPAMEIAQAAVAACAVGVEGKRNMVGERYTTARAWN